MIEKTLVVMNKKGIHARPASLIVQTTSTFKSSVHIMCDDGEINAKSIIGILTLGAAYKTEITFRIDGPDEEQALQAITKLFEKTLR